MSPTVNEEDQICLDKCLYTRKLKESTNKVMVNQWMTRLLAMCIGK